MIDEAVKLGGKLDGDSIIIYVLLLGLLSIIFLLLRQDAQKTKALNETAKHLAGISEQLRTLVSAALTSRRKDD